MFKAYQIKYGFNINLFLIEELWKEKTKYNYVKRT